MASGLHVFPCTWLLYVVRGVRRPSQPPRSVDLFVAVQSPTSRAQPTSKVEVTDPSSSHASTVPSPSEEPLAPTPAQPSVARAAPPAQPST
ncbi:hypothetical protein PR001_g16009 [Phytophthora rubi]|uniref:Uncharacterized protein n=1 Tax=Phytophthora rubi TaxID=129364 RepID=A0A6A3J330_9STRA|nr:hypothetical protein PR002_g21692 [Phytophthora rubi]KAE9011071.1 hypothetical protein PR001_g16009 [Phytophthora rubi]